MESIVIGRQFGSGGKLVAEAIGRKLSLKVYDKEIIAEAASKSGFSKELFEGSDEKRNLFSIASFLSSGRFGLADNYVGDDRLFKIQSDCILEIAGKGPAVFVGRCSDYILRDIGRLSVFVTAPAEVRKERVSERMGISPEDAESLLSKRDRARASYYDFFTYRNWGEASNYDLCIDSSVLGIEGTAEFIIEFGKKGGKL